MRSTTSIDRSVCIGPSNVSVYTGSHESESCGGETHVDIYRYDEDGHYEKEHSTDPSDIAAGDNLADAMHDYRNSDEDLHLLHSSSSQALAGHFS